MFVKNLNVNTFYFFYNYVFVFDLLIYCFYTFSFWDTFQS